MLRPNDLVNAGEDLGLGHTVHRDELRYCILETVRAGLDPCRERSPCYVEVVHEGRCVNETCIDRRVVSMARADQFAAVSLTGGL